MTDLKGILCEANLSAQSFFFYLLSWKSLTLKFKFVDFVCPSSLQKVYKRNPYHHRLLNGENCGTGEKSAQLFFASVTDQLITYV